MMVVKYKHHPMAWSLNHQLSGPGRGFELAFRHHVHEGCSSEDECQQKSDVHSGGNILLGHMTVGSQVAAPVPNFEETVPETAEMGSATPPLGQVAML